MNKIFKNLNDFVNGVQDEKENVHLKHKNKKHHEKVLTERIEDIVESGESKGFNKFYNVIAILLACVIIACMIYTVSFLPSFGNPNNPANNEVVQAYIENGIRDTGAVNFVAGMILNYRAFDTLGESTVLFIAATTVIILLFKHKTKEEEKAEQLEEAKYEDKHDLILRHGALIVVPATLVFGVYVLFNGHLSPGGGFSGGTIMGGALILYNPAFGDNSTKTFFNYGIHKVIKISALSFYALSQLYSFITGANLIESIISNGIAGSLISSGLILPLNICVGFEVACTMFGFYSLFDREEI